MREKLLTKRDVAEMLQVSVRTIERHIRFGELKAVYVTPCCPRFTEEEVEKFIRTHGGAR